MTSSASGPLVKEIVSKPVFTEALGFLRAGTELRILIDGKQEFALFHNGVEAVVENRPAQKPDVEFNVDPDGLRTLSALPGESMAAFGVEVVKLIAAGSIHVRVVGSPWNMASHGYLSLIKEAGPEFLNYLSQLGFNSMSRIVQLIRLLKK